MSLWTVSILAVLTCQISGSSSSPLDFKTGVTDQLSLCISFFHPKGYSFPSPACMLFWIFCLLKTPATENGYGPWTACPLPFMCHSVSFSSSGMECWIAWSLPKQQKYLSRTRLVPSSKVQKFRLGFLMPILTLCVNSGRMQATHVDGDFYVEPLHQRSWENWALNLIINAS